MAVGQDKQKAASSSVKVMMCSHCEFFVDEYACIVKVQHGPSVLCKQLFCL